MTNETELRAQERVIRKTLALVFIPIFFILITIVLIQDNSLTFLEKEYNTIHNSYYSGKITNLYLKQNNGRTKTICVDYKWDKEIPFFIYESLNIGDSLFKISKSDFEYYISHANNDTIKRDVNTFYRKKYIEKRNKN